MLKRRREPSPPPASSAGDSYAAHLNPQLHAPGQPAAVDDPDERATAPMPRAKRRRTAAPVLDGCQRGWAVPEDDDGEEDWVESDDDANRARRDGQAHAQAQPAADYQSVNSLLHNLHQQRRTVHPASAPVATNYASSARWSIRATSNYQAAAGKILPQTAASPMPHASPKLSAYDPAGRDPVRNDPTTACEMEHVRGRYEEMNRLLGSLALRRRHPDSSDGNGQGY